MIYIYFFLFIKSDSSYMNIEYQYDHGIIQADLFIYFWVYTHLSCAHEFAYAVFPSGNEEDKVDIVYWCCFI